MSSLLLFQLVDSAFPAGGFAHSGGLETAKQGGFVTDEVELMGWLPGALEHAAAGALGYVNVAVTQPDRCLGLCEHAATTIVNHVAVRASVAVGQGLLRSAAEAFPDSDLKLRRKALRSAGVAQHQAPIFGLICGSLDLDTAAAREAWCFTTIRDWLGAAIRLNIVGPMAAQRCQTRLSDAIAAIADRHTVDTEEDVAATSPLLDVLQGHHDNLYSRLFQS